MTDKTSDTADTQPTFFVRLRAHKPKKLRNGKMSRPPAKVEIANGDYRRSFAADEQPFAVDTEAELQLLKSTGLFVEAAPDEIADEEQPIAVPESPAAAIEAPAAAEPVQPAAAAKGRRAKGNEAKENATGDQS